MRIPGGKKGFITFDVEVVKADVPNLIELRDLKREGLLLNYVEDKLEHKSYGYSTPITYRHGHVFITWNANEEYSTQSKLRLLHLHFFHPSTGKLFNLLHFAYPTSADSSVKDILREIAISCENFREHSSSPLCLKAVIPPENLLFNHEIAIDLMWIEGIPIIHILYTHPGFQNATV